MKNIFTLLMVVSSLYAFSQSLDEAIKLYEDGKYNKSLLILEKLEQNTNTIHYIANCHFQMGNKLDACQLWADNDIEKSQDNYNEHCAQMDNTANYFTSTRYFSNDSTTKIGYCMILGTEKLLGKGVTIKVDFGDGLNKWNNNDILMNSNGDPIVFNSMIDAMNFMSGNGWEFVDAYAITTAGTNVYHWIMKKEFQ